MLPDTHPTPRSRADRPAAVAEARALVADPARAVAAGAQPRLFAWAILAGERGDWICQRRLIEMQCAMGVR